MSRVKLRNVVDICADCGAVDPSWASINKGILICDECCSVHRTLGRHISHIKSLRKGTWVPSQLAMVHALHSNGANSIWEYSLLDPANSKSGRRKPQPKDPVKPTKADFIRTKHQMMGFVCRNRKNEDKDSADSPEADVSKQLHSSVRTANLETSLRLLSSGADPNYLYQEKGTTPLHVAAGAGQASQIELLLVYGSDPGGQDSFRKTPSDHAKEAGYSDIAYRLQESQYELTDRISFYLCERKPDHSTNQHFLIPEMADSIDSNSEVAKSAKRKLQLLPHYLFEELAMDVYDEVDRRETESYWLSLQGPHVQTADRANVPFLPVNSELSATRNQARQKLGRLNAREFTTLLIDVLSEAKRRQFFGAPVLRESKFVLRSVQSLKEFSDDEPLYDSVPMEEESIYGDVESLSLQDQSRSPSQVKPNSTVPVEAYLGIKEELSLSNTRMKELLASNSTMQNQIGRLQGMVQTLVQENHSLKVQPAPSALTVPGSANGPAKSPVDEAITLRNRSPVVQRHCSMYEPREGPPRTVKPPPPTAEDVLRRTNVITKRIQEVFCAVQERRFEQVEPCGERVVEAVHSMATVCQQGTNDEVKLIAQQMTSNAARLLCECKSVHHHHENDPAAVTQRIIQGAYDVAKATKHLVTLFQ